MVWFRKPDELPIPENVRKLGRTVTSRSSRTLDVAHFTDISGIAIGFELNRKSIEEIILQLSSEVPAHSRTLVTMQMDDFPPGLKFTASRFDLPETSDDTEDGVGSSDSPGRIFSGVAREILSPHFPSTSTGIIEASMAINDSASEAKWAVLGDRPVLQESSDSPPELLPALDEPLAETHYFHFSLQILSRADAEILAGSR